MADPLYKVQQPSVTGRVTLPDGKAQLHWELRGGAAAAAGRVLLLNGAFATLRHYDELADALAAGGYEVLLFDYRHVGTSRASPPEPVTPNQTAELLAADALAVLNARWPTQSLHVYGASMGGFVAQRLALTLAPAGRLASLYLAVTCRGFRWVPPLNTWVFRRLMPLVIKSPPEAMVDQLLKDAFSSAYLDSVSPHPEAGGATQRQLWRKRWMEQYNELFTFGDPEVCAGQCPVSVRHYLSNKDAAALRNAGVPITVYVACNDALMPAKAQRKLAAVLGAAVVETDNGHMEASAEAFSAVVAHLRGASKSKAAAQQPEAGRG